MAILNYKQREIANAIIFNNIFTDKNCSTKDATVNDVLRYYRMRRYDEIPEIISED